ncbi:MAG: phosphotransferase family protein [Proteobacteria bacterium]|nr:phosphotransferase family protein [Pseudomonadota bacterium]
MELDELEERLVPFCRSKYNDDSVVVYDVKKMAGHAGFAYGFAVESRGRKESWFLRLPPPNVQWKGTADVLRQATVLKALADTEVPHCPLKWYGDDLEWFGRPYFVVPELEGDVIRMQPGEWAYDLPDEKKHRLGEQLMTALAKIHGIDWEAKTPGLGPPNSLVKDVTRWDSFYERVADPERLAKVPEVRQKLLDKLPENPSIGIFHGDFNMSNMFCSPDGRLLAVIDWELVGVGATLSDLGWVATSNDPEAWSEDVRPLMNFVKPETLIAMYENALGKKAANIDWFRAYSAYWFAIIAGFNLNLHRRGKRDDPLWETIGLSMGNLMDRALDLLG